MTEAPLDIDYADHEPVQELIETIVYCAEGVSISFERYDEEYVKGPGLYFAVISGQSVAHYADQMGANVWPVEECSTVFDEDQFYHTTREVALSRDGGIVVTIDGTILEQMVRFKDLTAGEDVPAFDHPNEYADWMGSRHMSAYDTSLRRPVVATITVSEESGRVTLFQSGEYDSVEREDLGGPWRIDD